MGGQNYADYVLINKKTDIALLNKEPSVCVKKVNKLFFKNK